MTANEGSTFQQQLDALVGQELGSELPAPDPVNLPMIRHWVAAFEDHDPVYLDEEVAAASRFGGVVAPPMMLQTWTMPTPLIEGIGDRGGSPTVMVEANPLTLLDDAGFVATLAATSEFEFDRYLHVGERISSSNTIESVSEEKQTRIGRGHFITWVTTFRDEQGEVVGRQRFGILKFKPEVES